MKKSKQHTQEDLKKEKKILYRILIAIGIGLLGWIIYSSTYLNHTAHIATIVDRAYVRNIDPSRIPKPLHSITTNIHTFTNWHAYSVVYENSLDTTIAYFAIESEINTHDFPVKAEILKHKTKNTYGEIIRTLP